MALEMSRPRAKKRATFEKAEPEGLSQEEAARRVGCAQSTIGRAIRRGEVELLTNGRIPESEIPKLIEARKADERESSVMADFERRLKVAETEKAEAQAKLKVMELERESGRFVELDSVKRAGADAAQRILAVLRALPQRCALEVDAALSAPPERRAAAIEKIVAREVERAVGEMRESMYLREHTPGRA